MNTLWPKKDYPEKQAKRHCGPQVKYTPITALGMKIKVRLYRLCLPLCLLWACEGGNTTANSETQERQAPREATDPVPEPTAKADTSAANSGTGISGAEQTAGTQEIHYRVSGNEPFWSLTIGRPYSTYRSMEGDSISFAYRAPQQAAGRQAGWTQLFALGEENWLLLRKGNSPCSDGMSDREHEYTATLWLNGQLLDGCANSQ